MLYTEDPTLPAGSMKADKNRKKYKQKLLLEEAGAEVVSSGENQICTKKVLSKLTTVSSFTLTKFFQ